MKEKLSKLKDDKNLIRIIFIIGIAGIFLIFCSSFLSSDKDDSSQSSSNSLADYGEAQEDKLRNMIEKIEGVGKAEVMLTMENSAEQVYTQDNRVKEIEPVVRGVVVVCRGATNPEVKATVMELVTKALNISSDKVCITKLREE